MKRQDTCSPGETTIRDGKGMAYEERSINLCYQTDEIEENAEITAPNTERCTVWQFVNSVAMQFPRPTESDVREADTAPDEKVGETRQG